MRLKLHQRAGNRHKASIALFIALQLILAVFASSTAIAASIKYDDSYTYEGGSSSDGIAWGGSSLSTKVESYPSSTKVACFDWCGDGTIDKCYGESGNVDKCKKSSSTLKGYCNAGKCETWGWWEFWRSIGEWHGIGTGTAGDKWTCSVSSRYFYDCTGTSNTFSDTSKTPYYVVYPRQFDCDGQKISTYDDEMSYGSTFDFRSDLSCSGSRLCNEDKDDSSADFGTYGTSKPSEPCSVPDGNQDCDSDSDCFSSSKCDCSWFGSCSWDIWPDGPDYCCQSGQKWDGSKCASPCEDNDGDGHKSSSCGGDDCNDGDSGVWKKNSCQVCAKEPSGIGNSCTVGTGACQRTGKYKCDNAGTGTVCDVSAGGPSTEVCDGVDNDCDGQVDEGVKNACGGCGSVPSETCGDSIDNNCNGQIDEGCCPDPKEPYYCAKTSSCWASKAQCDQVISCGNYWSACEKPEGNVIKCVDNTPGCCNAAVPYFCPKKDLCFSSDSYCDGRTVYNCNGKSNVCNKKTDVGTCFGDVLRCCPSGETWWESDKLCHKGSEPQKCSVPDGSSANCDCDSNSECPSGKPYCEENYPSPISDGHDGCISAVPEYCGNGKCAGSETYSSCVADCGSLAPKGAVTVGVYYGSGVNANKPISGASVSLDGVPKGTTDGSGRKSFEARYGSRNVKVECPDGAFCAEKSVGVDGTKYASFSCACATATQQFGELQIRVRTLHSEKDEGYPIYNAYVFLDNAEKGLTDIFGNQYVSKVNYGPHQLGIGLKIADKEGEEPYDHRYSFDLVVDELFENKTVNIVTTQQNILSQKSGSVESAVLTASTYNATYVPEAIPFIVVAVVTVGFVAWSYGDYAKCVEETDSWWGATGKLLWHGIKCNIGGLVIGQAIDRDHINNCGKKWTTIGKNTWEKCKLEFAFLGLSVIPAAWVAKAVGKVFIVIKGTVYTIPYVEKFLGYSIKIVKESDTVIKAIDGVSEFGYKLVGKSLQLYDNIVGMLVKIMGNAGVKKEIAEAVAEMLRATTAAEFKDAAHQTVNQIIGDLGERAAVKSADIASNELVKEGAEFVRPSGKAGELFGETDKYKISYNEKGKLHAVEKVGNDLGDFDDFYKINSKPIVTEVKIMRASLFDDNVPDKFDLLRFKPINGFTTRLLNRLEAFKAVRGETPEVILYLPKGEAVVSQQLNNMIDAIRNKGYKIEYVEIEASFDEFNKNARRIKDEATSGGK